MPRPQSENTFQVAFKIPESWVQMADELAESMSDHAGPGVKLTRTDALRAALWRGLETLSGRKATAVRTPKKEKKR